MPSKIRTTAGGSKRTVPEGLWIKCDNCSAVLYRSELERNFDVCPKCSHHERLGARDRLDLMLDPGGRYEIGAEIAPTDFLKFVDSKRYKERLDQAQKETGEEDALVVMQGSIKEVPLVCAAKGIAVATSFWQRYLNSKSTVTWSPLEPPTGTWKWRESAVPTMMPG